MKSMNDFAAIATRRENFTVASSSRCFHPTIYPIALLFFPLPTNLFPFFFFYESALLWYRFSFSITCLDDLTKDAGDVFETRTADPRLGTENSRKFSSENSKVEQRVRVAELGRITNQILFAVVIRRLGRSYRYFSLIWIYFQYIMFIYLKRLIYKIGQILEFVQFNLHYFVGEFN